jgi:signal transduction histidine kinase/ligand-binding sensor domain-containing protein
MKKGFLTGFLLILFSAFIFPQRPDLRLFNPLKNLKLSNGNVTAIEQDSLGYIWIGTRGGLNRFDGYAVKEYKYISGSSTCLINNEISKIFKDSHGRLWIGTHRGLCLYVPEYDQFKWMVHSHDSLGMEDINITDIREDNKGNLYCSGTYTVHVFQEDTGRFKPFYTLPKGEVSSFLFDREDNLWIAAFKTGGLIRYNGQTGNTKIFTHDEKNSNSISSNSLVSLALQGDKLWIATYDKGINCFDTKEETFKKFPVNNPYELSSRFVYVDHTDRVWSVDITGLKVFDPETGTFSGYYPVEGDPFSIKNLCSGIFQDVQENYWIMYSGEGVGLSLIPKGFIVFDNSPAKYWYTTAEAISAIGEDGNGNLWLGNPANGIEIFYWTQGTIQRFHYDPANPYGLGEGAIFSIFRDRDNRMWIGSYKGGLQWYDKSTGRFYNYRNIPDDTTSIAGNDIRSITEDEKGNLWIVVHGKGVDRFDREKRIFYHFNKKNNRLTNDYAYQVLIDSKGNLWVATVWGLSVLKKGEAFFSSYFSVDRDSTSVSDNEIISLYEDYKEQLWVGTTNGLNRYDYTTNTFKRYSGVFASDIINVILGDKFGQIWIGTPKGITRFDPETGVCSNFNENDGILPGEIYVRSGYINTDSALFFGGMKGIDIVVPDKLKLNMKPPRVLITGLKIFNKGINTYSENGVLKKHITYTKRIRLKYNQNVISLEFLAVNMINTEKNEYAYKLEGLDKEWTYAGKNREVTYTNLDPKKYIFRVKACNNVGYWNNEGTSLEILILPPWYKTLFFRIMLSLLVIAGYVIFHKYRMAQLTRQKIYLENQVRERTLELYKKNALLEKQTEELNDTNTQLEERQQYIEEQSEELQAQAAELLRTNQELILANQTKDKLFSLIAHDLKDPFNTLLGFTDLLTKEFGRISDEQKITIIKMVRISSERIHDLLENLLRWARSQSGMMVMHRKKFRIIGIINSIVSIFQHTTEEKKISIRVTVPEDLELFADEDMISTVIRNLLNNAIKFTPKEGTITIEAKEQKKQMIITFTDSGVGISEELRKTLFNPVKSELQRGTAGEKGSGLGLLLCKEFIEVHGGEITVQSEPGKGSTFMVFLPV